MDVAVIVKTCEKHGELGRDAVSFETVKGSVYFRCIQCKRDKDARWKDNNRDRHRASASRARNIDRSRANEWARKDRQNNPEKYRKYEKNYIEKHGIEKVRRYEVLRQYGLSVEQHDQMLLCHNGVCAICKQHETRKTRSGLAAPLCIDHCHKTNKVRGLLCFACNTALGKFSDSPTLLRRAADYLEDNLL